MTNRTWALAGSIGLVISGVAGVAAAQDITSIQPAPAYSRGFNTAVRERPHPEWDPFTLPLGSFRVEPEVFVTSTFTDNEKDVSTNTQSDFIVSVDPRVSFSSDWTRHLVFGGLNYTRNQNTNVTSDSSNEYGANGGGRLDIYSDLTLNASLSGQHVADPSSDPDAPTDRKERPMFDREFGQLQLTKSLPRVQLQGTINYLSLNFDSVTATNGSHVDLSARNSEYTNFVGKATYALSPELALFLGGLVDKTSRPSSNGINQDSSGFTLGGGANFDLSRLARGEVQLGYYNEGYNVGGLKADTGLNVQVDVQYFPTQLTTVSFSLAKSALTNGRPGSTNLVQSANAINSPGGSALSGGVTVDHELLRNVILSANVGAGQADYAGIDRTDKSFAAGLGATYLVNRHIGLDLSYQYRDFNSSGHDARRSYTDNRLLLTTRFSY